MNICLVGLGNHGLGRVLPAILKSKSKLIATVSSKRKISDKNYNIKNFKNLSLAISSLSNKTIFVLTTPPQIHEKQIIILIKKGYSVIVEKPAFLSEKYYYKFLKLKIDNNFVFENFMYKETKIYKKFFKIFNNKKDEIRNININFCIPKFPENSFRDKLNIIDVLVFDICCYPISLINSLFDIDTVPILKKRVLKQKKRFVIYFNLNDIRVNIKFGISRIYQNSCTINTQEEKIIFDYFFYGLKKKKKLIFKNKNKNDIEIIDDNNSFISIFNNTNDFFIKHSLSHKYIKTNYSILNNIKNLCYDS